MNFSTYMNISVYLMALTGILSIALVEEIDAFFVLVAGLVTLVSLITKIYKPNKTIPPTLLNILSITLLALFFTDYLIITNSLIGAATRFITILALLKLFDLKNRTDYMLLSMLVFFQLLSASASTVSPLFFLVLSMFTICSIWSMVLFNIEQDWNDHLSKSTVKKPLPTGMFSGNFFTGTVIITFISIGITLSLFFIIPRVGVGLMHRDTLNTIKVSGFADEVDLSDIGSVKLDNTVVMRVEIAEHSRNKIKKHPLYLRGKTFKTYKENKWIKDSEDKVYTKKAGDTFNISKRNKNAIEHTILLEPLSTSVIFTLSYPQAVEGNFHSLWKSPSNTLQLSRAPFRKIQYTAWSYPESGVKGPEDISEYLNSPEGYGEIKKLTLNIIGSEKNTLKKINKLNQYLKKGYTYSLSPKKGDGETPLHDFLFYTKEGYCEQFSTALTIMLRLAGIPARLATGFLEGQWNDYGNYYIVRQRDAHSWVEVFVENNTNGGKWITVDPTPPTSTFLDSSTSTISLYIDSLQMKWNRYIVNFTSDDQITMAHNMETGALTLKDKIKDLMSSKPSGRHIIISVSIIFIILIASLLYFKKISQKTINNKTPKFYLQMLKILDKKGLKKNHSETPLEFAQRCNINDVEELTKYYIEIRYGKSKAETDFYNKTDRLLKELKNKTIDKLAS